MIVRWMESQTIQKNDYKNHQWNFKKTWLKTWMNSRRMQIKSWAKQGRQSRI
jgi:hypothetical protein